MTYTIRNNLLRVYYNEAWPQNFDFQVQPGVQSELGMILATSSTTLIQLPRERPQVRFLGRGTIIPDASQTYIPVETRNLKAVMVRALHVPDAAMHQFMQNN